MPVGWPLCCREGWDDDCLDLRAEGFLEGCALCCVLGWPVGQCKVGLLVGCDDGCREGPCECYVVGILLWWYVGWRKGFAIYSPWGPNVFISQAWLIVRLVPSV